MTYNNAKQRHREFQAERRKVQRQVVQSVLLCGLILILMYALIIIATGIFIIYTQFFAPDIISNLNTQSGQFMRMREKREDERLKRDPIARLLQYDGNPSNLQTFAPYEDYADQPSEEEKQLKEAADVVETFQNSRFPLEFGLNRWVRSRKLASISMVEKELDEKKRKKRSACIDEIQIIKQVPPPSSDTFPTDLFTLDQRRHGAIVFHLCGLCYMFVALAIVCDEFFVPALGVISEVLEISDNVAGATFMAGGGSAPEFFTSVFGVFITQNNVGIGTIVGSATFNILFVLSFCTFFSKQVLHLTWFPMFRDMFFYVTSLLLLLIFFVDEVVDWYEALILFILYVIYGIFMKYNTKIERIFKRYLRKWSNSVGIDKKALVETENSEVTNDGPFISKHLPIISTVRTLPLLHTGAMFRAGLVNIAMDPGALAGSDSNIGSSPDDRFDDTSLHPPHTPTQLHPPLSKTRSSPSMRASLPQICLPHASSQLRIAGNIANLPLNDLPASSRTTSSIWSTSTGITHSKLTSARPNNGHTNDVEHLPRATNGHLHLQVENNQSKNHNLKRISVEVEPEKPIDMTWPSTFYKRFMYVLLAPIMFPLYYTLPDVKKPNRRQLFLWSFTGSILYIAFYSYLMVWWANTIGETIGLPSEIMGLTILAAGTSIPDLITSVIVARKGLGDMAVSSSIGSNLFDVCVGLPIPWLLYYGVNSFRPGLQPISVSSNGLICSVGMLFMMLLLLYISVAISGWKMSKKFGLTMIFAYAIFCTLSILLEVEFLTCPLKRLPVGINC